MANGYAPGIKTVLSGALTANTLATILSLSGTGVVSFVAAESVDATSRTHRIKITLDGVVVFDATSAAVATVQAVCPVIGAITNATGTATSVVTFEPLAFNASLLIEYASSVTETDKSAIGYRYYPT